VPCNGSKCQYEPKYISQYEKKDVFKAPDVVVVNIGNPTD